MIIFLLSLIPSSHPKTTQWLPGAVRIRKNSLNSLLGPAEWGHHLSFQLHQVHQPCLILSTHNGLPLGLEMILKLPCATGPLHVLVSSWNTPPFAFNKKNNKLHFSDQF